LGNIVKLPRRTFLHLAAGAAALPVMSRTATAQAYPTRPITIVVPYPAGGPTDTLARILAEHLRVSLGQPVIIENVSGAGGSIGVGRVARGARWLHRQHRALANPCVERCELSTPV
jgi:tripartite-type tricarboxylate transporter receptor subunit TctC